MIEPWSDVLRLVHLLSEAPQVSISFVDWCRRVSSVWTCTEGLHLLIVIAGLGVD